MRTSLNVLSWVTLQMTNSSLASDTVKMGGQKMDTGCIASLSKDFSIKERGKK